MDIISQIKDIIDIEIEGLLNLKDKVNSDFKQVVEKIYSCRGKIILSGMGKSGLIAKKIASTMSSTGTPAVFMHPAEGMHGDLGMVTPEDIVIAISKSGESPELNCIFPGVRIIGSKVDRKSTRLNS